jgi:hypothetical protein
VVVHRHDLSLCSDVLGYFNTLLTISFVLQADFFVYIKELRPCNYTHVVFCTKLPFTTMHVCLFGCTNLDGIPLKPDSISLFCLCFLFNCNIGILL